MSLLTRLMPNHLPIVRGQCLAVFSSPSCQHERSIANLHTWLAAPEAKRRRGILIDGTPTCSGGAGGGPTTLIKSAAIHCSMFPLACCEQRQSGKVCGHSFSGSRQAELLAACISPPCDFAHGRVLWLWYEQMANAHNDT